MTRDLEKNAIIESERMLRYISRMVKKNGRKILKNFPITSSQFIALQWITEKENLTIGELSEKLGLAFSTTTDLIDRMEQNKLIKRVRDKKDRRVVRLHVLTKGRTIIEEVIEKRQQYLGYVLNHFSTEKQIELNENLQLLYEQMIVEDENIAETLDVKHE